MTKRVDARGLSCPQPVILARQAIRAGEFPVEVLVDTRTSCDNVRRAVAMTGHSVEVVADAGDFRLAITR